MPTTSDLPYEFRIIPLKQLVVDEYQRPLTTFVKKIAENFDPALVGTLAVSERSKTKFALIDGQTRAEGMRRAENGPDSAPCIVYKGLSLQQEATLFAKFQKERRGMSSGDRFKAEVVAGDEHAVAISELVAEAGFQMASNMSEHPNAIAAVAAVEWLYWGARAGRNRVPHPELVTLTLTTIRAVWPKLPEGARGRLIIQGMGHFLHNNSDIDLDRLNERVGRVQPSEIAKRAAALREGRGLSGQPPSVTAEAIEMQYRRRT